jgi:two-component system, sensor histidine kinase and response regulator
MNAFTKIFFNAEKKIRFLGCSPGLNGHEKKKLGIFNLLNFSYGIMLGIVIPFMTWLRGIQLPILAWCGVCLGPILATATVSILTGKYKYEQARVCFFILHPLVLTGIYAMKVDIGTDLFFVCCGILSVFIVESIYTVIFSFSLSMTCYFMAHGFARNDEYSLETVSYDLFLFNRLIAIFFIFYGIFRIRNENVRYQLQITDKNRRLRSSNGKIRAQKRELTARASQMQEQAIQLSELNSLKNKLFSVIAHDLRSPLHALHNLFRNMERYDLPGDEIKILIPDVVKDLGHTVVHIENLLQWAKTQMHSEALQPEVLDISTIIFEVLGFLHLQVKAKKLHVETVIGKPVYVYADNGMINLVLRNLLSNAIKFTPEEGTISLGATDCSSHIRVFVQDTGTGIDPENLKKLREGLQYTTAGTANESGTGLGLILCREFLSRNGGKLEVFSKPGTGSVFSFTLPKGD